MTETQSTANLCVRCGEACPFDRIVCDRCARELEKRLNP